MMAVPIWLALFALYLLFAGTATGAELGAAALVALVGCAFAIYLRRQGHRPMRLKAPFARLFRRVAVALARDTVTVGIAFIHAVLGRKAKGVIQRQPFDTRDDSEEQVGRRALVIFAASIAPNSFVLEEDGVSLEVHQLVREPPKVDRQWPV